MNYIRHKKWEKWTKELAIKEYQEARKNMAIMQKVVCG